MQNPFACPDPLYSDIYMTYWMTPIRSTFCWVPAHKGHIGNEAADFLAKSGASSFHFSIPLARPMYRSKGVLKTELKRQLEAHLRSNWESAIANRPYTASLIPDYDSLTKYRRLSSSAFLVNRLISGHIQTRKYKRDKLNLDFSGMCPHCAVPDTSHHHVLACPALAPLRLQYLGHPDLTHLHMSDLLQDKNSLQALHNFLRSTL